jgi:Holliday junction resolvasome RuvABC endonuclease subunit
MASYLGIDASLEGTGLSLVSGAGTVRRMTTVNPKGVRGMARLAMIKAATIDCLTQHSSSDPVAGAAIEGYAYNAVNQAFSLGEVGGVLRLLLHEHGIAYVDVPPVSLKKYATGSTQADKTAMMAAAVAAGVAPEDHNQADAYFLALIAATLSDGNELAHLRQRSKLEVVRSLTNPTRKKARRRPRRLVENPV